MKIDFSQGIEYWKEIINTLLAYINDFWTLITGSPLFSNGSEGALGFDEENFSLPTLDD